MRYVFLEDVTNIYFYTNKKNGIVRKYEFDMKVTIYIIVHISSVYIVNCLYKF